MDDIVDIVNRNIDDLIDIYKNNRDNIIEGISLSSRAIANSINRRGKVFLCGNGGSASDSQHLAAEFVVRLSANQKRPAYPAIALTTDTSIITASGNDFGFEEIFARQIEALGSRGDILIAISTSGNSKNINKAILKAKDIGILIIALLGGDGGVVKEKADISIIIPSDNTARVQEAHINIGHSIVECVEEILKKS